MSSKRPVAGFRKILLAGTLVGSGLLLWSSCGLLGDSIANPIFPSNNIASEAGCMPESFDQLGRFFSGDASSGSMMATVSCFEEALELFGKKVRGENPNYYKPREVANFIENQYLGPRVKVSTELLTEIMRIKQLFVGGTLDQMTREELSGLKTFVRDLGPLFSELAPLMKIYSGQWPVDRMSRTQALGEFAAAESAFATKIRATWPKFKSIYDLANLQTLANSLKANFPTNPSMVSLHRAVSQYLPLVIAAKNILLNDDQSILSTGDWAKLLQQLPALFSRYLYYSYFLNKASFFWKTGLTDFDQWVHDVLRDLQNVLKGRGQGTAVGITLPELSRLMDGLGTAEFLTGTFSAATMKAILPVAIQRLLTAPDDRLRGNKETTLSPLVIRTFQTEFEGMIAVQKKLDGMINQSPTWSHAQLQSAFSGANGFEGEFAKLLQTSSSFAVNDLGHMHIDVGSDIPYTASSLQRLNVVRTLVRLAIRAYARDAGRINSLAGLSKDEVLNEAFPELKPFLVESQLIEASNTTFAKNRFIEANLFTPAGNGDTTIDFYEGAAIGLMIWSGLSLHDGFEKQVESGCSLAGSNPPLYDVPCSLEVIRQRIPSVATALPRLANTFQTLPQGQGATMLLQILKAAGWEPNTANTAKMGDIGLVPHTLQYIESIFRRWDSNKDDILNKAEAMVAEPTFRPLLAEISGQTNADVLRAAFAYILIYKKNPADDFFGFLFFMNDEANWNIRVARTDIAEILGFIGDQMRNKSLQKLKLIEISGI